MKPGNVMLLVLVLALLSSGPNGQSKIFEAFNEKSR